MKLMIAGSRSITDFDLSPYVPQDADMIISGGAAGVDALAEAYADRHRITKLIVRPDYARYGRAAPIKRNESMVDMADCVLVIWNGSSKGSAHTLAYAKKQGKRVIAVVVS